MPKLNFEKFNEITPESHSESLLSKQVAPDIILTFYTDPVCIWSWAFEPHWIRLLEALASQVIFNIRMGGLIYPDSDIYKSPYTSSEKALRHSIQVAHQTGVEFAPALWLKNEIQSSYPACIAFHCVVEEQFSKQILFLRKLRQNYFLFARNFMIEKDFLLLLDEMEIDRETFRKYWHSGRAYKELLVNLASNNASGIHSFPTIGLKVGNAPPVFFHGYHDYYKLKTKISEILPKLKWSPIPDFDYILRFYGPLTSYEIIQLFDLSPELLDAFLSRQKRKARRKDIGDLTLYYYNE